MYFQIKNTLKNNLKHNHSKTSIFNACVAVLIKIL